MNIAVLGAGKMGISFSRSFLKYDLVKPEKLHLIVRNSDKKTLVLQEFPDSRISQFDEVQAIDANLIIVAVKPQDFHYVAKNVHFKIPDDALILSIMAGITISKIQEALNYKLVVRAMPNAPTLLGMGITGYTAAPGISFQKLIQVERLLNATGRSVYLEEENLLDSVTALSGSGPAYFYYIVDAMIKAGTEKGIEENLSQLFVQQTMLGAYHLINNSEKSLDELITDVASKGGTTEAALNSFNGDRLQDIIKKGILAAEKRASDLNKNSG